jgi:hypothetical protein
MNEEQLERAIEFLTQSQADSAVRNAVIEENFQKLQARQDRFQDRLEELAKLTHDLVTVAQMHSRRLDRLDGIQPY